jgi:hypothetical protein
VVANRSLRSWRIQRSGENGKPAVRANEKQTARSAPQGVLRENTVPRWTSDPRRLPASVIRLVGHEHGHARRAKILAACRRVSSG